MTLLAVVRGFGPIGPSVPAGVGVDDEEGFVVGLRPLLFEPLEVFLLLGGFPASLAFLLAGAGLLGGGDWDGREG